MAVKPILVSHTTTLIRGVTQPIINIERPLTEETATFRVSLTGRTAIETIEEELRQIEMLIQYQLRHIEMRERYRLDTRLAQRLLGALTFMQQTIELHLRCVIQAEAAQ
jgi:hypothetical protein